MKIHFLRLKIAKKVPQKKVTETEREKLRTDVTEAMAENDTIDEEATEEDAKADKVKFNPDRPSAASFNHFQCKDYHSQNF